MKEFSATLANKPGQLAALAGRLADAGINIESLAAIGADGESLVRFIPDDEDVARRVLNGTGLVFEERTILDTFLPNEPGALAAMTQRLADAGVNIDSIYLLHSNADRLHFAITVDDPDLAHTELG